MTVHADTERHHDGAARRGDDAGFTLVEVLVAVAIIAVVMLGVGAVFVATAAGTDVQGLRQTAARIATDGLDRAHALTGSDVVKGRDTSSVDKQWAARPTAVDTLLGALPKAYDTGAVAGSGRTAQLPTTAIASTVDGVTFQQAFFVSTCQLDGSSVCAAGATAGSAPMYDVAVAVSWRDRTCAGGTCTYLLSTLIAANVNDPLFNSNVVAVPPTVAAVANRVQDVGEAVTGLTATFTGGNGAVTLTAGGLPPGVTFDPTTGRFGGAPTAPTTTTVTVTAIDRFGLPGSTTFVWTVNPLPALTAAALPLVFGTAANVGLADLLQLTGGTAPVTWACTGLPAGIAVDRATGILTGSAALPAVTPASCTVTDARGKTSTATLTLAVTAPPLVLTSPAANTTVTYTTASPSFTATATGCVGACTWSVKGLPKGLTLNTTTGVVTGLSTKGSSTVAFTVTDTLARTTTATVTWTVK